MEQNAYDTILETQELKSAQILCLTTIRNIVLYLKPLSCAGKEVVFY